MTFDDRLLLAALALCLTGWALGAPFSDRDYMVALAAFAYFIGRDRGRADRPAP